MAVQVLHLGTVLCRFVERQAGGLLVCQRQIETVAKFKQVVAIELFLAVCGHLALPGRAHAVALFGVGKNHSGLARVARSGRVGSVDLHQIMPATFQAVDLLIGHALRQRGQLGVLAKEVVAVKAPILRRKGLHLAVHRALQRTRQGAREIAGKQSVPVTAPDELDDVPARSGKQALQFINDAAVAAHRAVEPLQIAVDDPNQVVEPLTRGQRESAGALGFVHLTVAKDPPHFAARAVDQLAVREVVHEPRVVDAADGTEAHRTRRELPEIGHQPGMRIARQTLRTCSRRSQFLPVMY